MTFITAARVRGSEGTTAPSQLGRVAGIDVVLWPEEAERRASLSDTELPCLLVISCDETVPHLGPLEDWVREPLEADEVRARCLALGRRAGCGRPPTLDDGLLVHDGAWAAIPPAQVAIVELLVERMGSVVRREELVAAAAVAGGSDHEEAVKAAMGRLATRLAPLGLCLRTIRGRGYLLEVESCCPLHGTRSAAEP